MWRSVDFADAEGGPFIRVGDFKEGAAAREGAAAAATTAMSKGAWRRGSAYTEERTAEREKAGGPHEAPLGATWAWTSEIERSCGFRSGSRVERRAPGECAR